MNGKCRNDRPCGDVPWERCVQRSWLWCSPHSDKHVWDTTWKHLWITAPCNVLQMDLCFVLLMFTCWRGSQILVLRRCSFYVVWFEKKKNNLMDFLPEEEVQICDWLYYVERGAVCRTWCIYICSTLRCTEHLCAFECLTGESYSNQIMRPVKSHTSLLQSHCIHRHDQNYL